MKVIDLLNKIANGEEVPKKVKYKGHIYTYQYKETKEANIINYYHSDTAHHHLIDGGYHDIRLNDEIEIIEEEKKIIEKIGLINYYEDPATLMIHLKVDEIIDYINSKEDSNAKD